MKGPVRLATVVRAVALEQAVGFMQDVSAEQFPRDRTDVDCGDSPVILPHVVLTFECHARSAPRMRTRPSDTYRPDSLSAEAWISRLHFCRKLLYITGE